MRTMKLVSTLMAGLVVVVCLQVADSAALDGADDALLKGQTGPQTGEKVDDASGGRSEAAAAAKTAGAKTAGAETAGAEGAAAAPDAAANPPENPGAQTGSAEAASEEASASEEDAEAATPEEEGIPANSPDMKDSLADYVLDLFTTSDNASTDTRPKQGPLSTEGNGKQPQAAGDAAAAAGDGGESGAGGNQTPQEGAGASAESVPGGSETTELGNGASSSGTDQGGAGGAAKEDNGEDDRWNGDQWSSGEEGHAPTTKPVVDCTKEVELRDYCKFMPDALVVFHNKTTLEGLRAAFLNMDIVQQLITCTRRGEWCIGNKLDVLKDMQKIIYDSALCSEFMWECIFDIMDRRLNCTEDKEFLFAVDSLDLLCSLTGVESFLPDSVEAPTPDTRKCIAHVQAALHVSYADFLANGLTHAAMSEDALCDGYAFRMSKTYLCADESCKGQYESRKAMEEFGLWNWFLVNLDERLANCRVLKADTCGPLQEAGTAAAQPTDWFGMSTTTSTTPFWLTTTEPTDYQHEQVGEPPGSSAGSGEGHPGMFGEMDDSLMISLSVATAVTLLFMVLGLFFFWRRRQGRNAYYYRTVSDGYDKVPSDEAHLLGRSSSD